MRQLVATSLAALAGLTSTDADAAMQTNSSWNPASRPGFWCGTGLIPQGHAVRELRSSNGSLELTMTVRQQDDQLCYVVDGIAEAPLLRLHSGDHLTITLRNEINDPSLIDTFIPTRYLLHPNNEITVAQDALPVESGMRHEATGATNLHMHGFPVPPVAPQDETLKTCADPTIGSQACGTRQIVYRYVLPANMPAGLYWYHPHVHGEVQAQILMGLSGPIVVEGPDDDARRAQGIEDRVLIVRQTADTEEGRDLIPPKGAVLKSMSHERMDHEPMAMGAMSSHPMGSTGLNIDTEKEVACGKALADPITLNGAPIVGGRPLDQDIALFTIPAGHQQLWRLVNGSTDFYLNLVLIDENNRPQPIKVVSWDGVPQADDMGHPEALRESVEPQLLSPASRIEFLIESPPQGKTFYLVSRQFDTGCAGDDNPERLLARVIAQSDGDSPAETAPPMDTKQDPKIGIFAGLLAAKTMGHRRLAFTEYPRPGYVNATDFFLTEIKPGAMIRPYHMNGPPNFSVRAGVVEEWDIENWTRELHAFHTHQVHFRVLAVNGKPLADPPLRDVINVPFATPIDTSKPDGVLKPGIVRIKIVFPPEFVGDVPIHCHLVDHEDNGMMAVVHVEPQS